MLTVGFRLAAQARTRGGTHAEDALDRSKVTIKKKATRTGGSMSLIERQEAFSRKALEDKRKAEEEEELKPFKKELEAKRRAASFSLSDLVLPWHLPLCVTWILCHTSLYGGTHTDQLSLVTCNRQVVSCGVRGAFCGVGIYTPRYLHARIMRGGSVRVERPFSFRGMLTTEKVLNAPVHACTHACAKRFGSSGGDCTGVRQRPQGTDDEDRRSGNTNKL